MSIAKKLMTTGAKGDEFVDDVFSTYLYTGNNSTNPIVNGVDLDGEGGLVWIKNRQNSKSHGLFDTERGPNNQLYSDTTSQAYDTPGLGVSSFNSDGFTLAGAGTETNAPNDYASWTFRKAKKFFDVVTYTGDGVGSGREIPHKLGCRAGMIIIKRVDSNSDWVVQHIGNNHMAGENKANNVVHLNTSEPRANAGPTINFSDTYFNVVGQGQGIADNRCTNLDGAEYVAYVFAHDDSDESMIKCGTYDGIPQPANPEVDLGWEPQWVMIKRVDGTGNWTVVDSMRGITDGPMDQGCNPLRLNTSEAEFPFDVITLTSTGFIVNGSNADFNSGANGAKYIYMAIRRPNKPAKEFEPEELFAVDTMGSTGDSKPPAFRSDFPVDMAIRSNIDSAVSHDVVARLMQGKTLQSDLSSAETDSSNTTFDFMNGWRGTSSTNASWVSHMWRRAPGFMDVVTYEGDGVTGREVDHNLGVMPEMVIHKHRSHSSNWTVWHHQVSGPGREWWEYGGNLNEDYAFGDKNTQQSDPTSSTWPVESGWTNVAGRTNVLYLFASVPGISKVGSYTGNGSEVEVDCGFTNGARWVLIKKTNSSGDWYFTSNPSNFKILSKLNTTDAQVNYQATFNDVPSGFRVTSTSGGLNDNGDEYIFYAIA